MARRGVDDYPPLTPAQQDLVTAYLAEYDPVRGVRARHPSLYRACRASGMGDDDIHQVAALGLMRAASGFDPAGGNRFVTYASWWVRGYLSHAVRRAVAQRPAGVVSGDQVFPGSESGEDLWAALGLAGDAGADPAEDDRRAVLRARVAAVLRALTRRERQALTLRYGLDGGGPRILEAVAARMGVTRQRVAELEKVALRKVAVRLQVKCFGLVALGRGAAKPAGARTPDPRAGDACPACGTPYTNPAFHRCFVCRPHRPKPGFTGEAAAG